MRRLAPIFPFGRARPGARSPAPEFLRRLGRGLAMTVASGAVALAVAFGILLVCPSLAFAHQLESSGIRLYSQQPIPPPVASRLDAVAERLQASGLNALHRRAEVFLCDNEWTYRLLALQPRPGGEFGLFQPISGRVFLRKVSPDFQWCLRPASRFARRDFGSTVTHELAHKLIRAHLGLWRNHRLPAWKAEGAADFIAGRSTLSDDEAVTLIRAGAGGIPALRYWLWREMIAELVSRRGQSLAEVLVASDLDEEATRRAVLARWHAAPPPSPSAPPSDD